MTGEIVRFSPTLKIDGVEVQHIRRGQPSPIRLVFWVEFSLGLDWLLLRWTWAECCAGPWVQRHGPNPLRVYNKWYQSKAVKIFREVR